MADGNGKDPFDRKYTRHSFQKKPGLTIYVTELDIEGNRHIDIRERVDDPKPRPDGTPWDGWTGRGICMPVRVFRELVAAELEIIEKSVDV